jgi:hypothetical protein
MKRPLALALACAGITLSLVAVANASEGAPATVTVRVEGPSSTLLPPTTVTTTAMPVIKDGNAEHSCPGTTAAGALQLATGGSWNGTWFSGFGYSVETIEGLSYPFTQPFFWSFWLDGKPASVGVCGAQLNAGDSILFFPECFSETVGECPPAPNPLAIDGPPTTEEKAPVTFAVISYPNAGGSPGAAKGATVQDPQEHTSAITDAGGHASLTFATPGVHTVQVSAPESVRSETTICVHNVNDGNCGTTPPPGTAPAPFAQPQPGATPYKGPFALVASVSGLGEHSVYAPGQAPRTLAGAIHGHSAIVSVRLRLRRSYHGRCYAYDGVHERFQRARCGTASFFQVASGPAFSYLLPSALKPGRYVLDVQATDAAGNVTTLARGSTRVVFYVR